MGDVRDRSKYADAATGLAGQMRATVAELVAEVSRLAQERDEARAEVERLAEGVSPRQAHERELYELRLKVQTLQAELVSLIARVHEDREFLDATHPEALHALEVMRCKRDAPRDG